MDHFDEEIQNQADDFDIGRFLNLASTSEGLTQTQASSEGLMHNTFPTSSSNKTDPFFPSPTTNHLNDFYHTHSEPTESGFSQLPTQKQTYYQTICSGGEFVGNLENFYNIGLSRFMPGSFTVHVTIVKKKIKKQNLVGKGKKYIYRNTPKIFGQRIIKMIKTHFFSGENELSNCFYEEYRQLKQERQDFQLNDSLKPKNFLNWIDKKKLMEEYVNLKCFRDIWTKNPNLDFKEDLFRRVLTRMTRIFFEEYAYFTLIKNDGIKKINEEKIDTYIDMIPKFLYGLDNPALFTQLKDEDDEYD